MKKIALCLHGQPRGFEIAIGYQNKNLISRKDISVDVFFHTWDYSDKINGINQKLLNLYKPKAFLFQAPLDTSVCEKYEKGHNNSYRNYSHYYSVFNSCCVRNQYEQKNNMSYDWVVSTRFDVALNIHLDFEKMNHSKVYQSDFDMGVYLSRNYKVSSDAFAVGSPENMNKYASILPNIDTLYEMNGGDIDGHAMFGANIKLNGLVDKMEPLNMSHPFSPDRYGCSSHSFVRNDYDLFNSLSK